MRTWPAGRRNLRRGQSPEEKDGEAGPREGTGKILSLKVPLTRGKGRAIANFEREFDFNWEL